MDIRPGENKMPVHSALSSAAIHLFHDSKLSKYSKQNLTNKREKEICSYNCKSCTNHGNYDFHNGGFLNMNRSDDVTEPTWLVW